MKKCFFGAIAVLALASCSNEKVVELSQDQEIKLTATAGKALSRADDGYCNESLPTSFKVWAKQGQKNYFAGQTFTKTGDNWAIPTGDPVRYWPESGTLDLFAALNYEGAGTTASSVTWTPSSTTAPAVVSGFKVSSTVSEQKDFIYAVSMGTVKKTSGIAAINFRHALSQIVFKAKNENPNIYVEVTGVSVCQATTQGTFTFPVLSTSDNIVDTNHKNPYEQTITDAHKFGKWDLDEEYANYAVTFDAVGLNANQAEAQSLTYANKEEAPAQEWNTNTMYLLPQKFEGKLWSSAADGYKKPGDVAGKAYFLLTAKIWNVATPSASDAAKGGCDTTNDVLLWDTKNIAIEIPTNTVWEQGKKYVYTFKFTKNGNGGWDPTPGTPTPIFTPIQLSVTVDDFADETTKEVPMN